MRWLLHADGAASCRRDELEDFIYFVSNFHPALQFTSTTTETELPFLFRILSTDQQTRDIFPQPPIVAYKRDLSLQA